MTAWRSTRLRVPVGVAEGLEPGAAKEFLAGGLFQQGRLLALELRAVLLEQVLRPVHDLRPLGDAHVPAHAVLTLFFERLDDRPFRSRRSR